MSPENQDNTPPSGPRRTRVMTTRPARKRTDWPMPPLSEQPTRVMSSQPTQVQTLPGSSGKPVAGLSPMPHEKYRVVTRLGQGGMKTIHRARDKDATRLVAMATLRAEQSDEDSIRRFVHEARITAFLEHPNIVPVHDIGTDEKGQPYFTMKLLDGESLQDVLEKLSNGNPRYVRTFTLPFLLEIFLRICHAIGFAHSKGVVHLDVKPSNIQVNDFGEVLVIDWGLAKFLDQLEPVRESSRELVSGVRDMTLEGAVKGTPGYMAPEQARGENTAKDTRTDIYALGAILYSFLTWRSPALTEDVETVIQDTIAGRITPPSERTPHRQIPPALEAVAMKALALRPEDRYASVEELRRDILAYTGGFAVSAQDVGLLTLLWMFIKRHKITASLVFCSLSIIASVIASSMIQIRAQKEFAEEQARRAQAELQRRIAAEKERKELGLQALDRVQARGLQYMQDLRFDDALKDFALCLSLDRNLVDTLLFKGYLHLGRMQFAEAHSAFEKARKLKEAKKPPPAKKEEAKPESDPSLHPYDPEVIALRLQAWTQNGLRPLDDETFLKFIGELLKMPEPHTAYRDMILAQLFETDNSAAFVGEAQCDRIAASLALLNPKARGVRVDYDSLDEGTALIVSGDQKLRNILPLRGLDVVWLDISYTGVNDLRWLSGMRLVYLDLAGTGVRDLLPLFGMPLKELRVDNCRNLDYGYLRRKELLDHLERLVVSKRLGKREQDFFKAQKDLTIAYW